MAQREQHERVKKMDRWAGKLLGHKAVVMAILVVIAMASGLAMANLGGSAGGVSFERTDGSGSLVEPGSGDASSGKTSEGSSTKASAAAEVYVDVDGAVVSPGVYRLKDGARVAQAIDAAGGLAPEADVTGLNRASKVVDGQKIHVPTVGEQQASIAEAGVDVGASASSGVSGATGLVNINTASAEELQTLSGIGPSMAQSIIDERTKNGAFASVDDLMRVSGIGEILTEAPPLPELTAVLVNPNRPVSTPAVFRKRSGEFSAPAPIDEAPADVRGFITELKRRRNDLAAAAEALEPSVSEVLAALRACPGCALARMSGSGGTCFGIFEKESDRGTCVERLRRKYPFWWIQSAKLL